MLSPIDVKSSRNQFRSILINWIIATMVLTFLFKNQILASLSSTHEDLIDSFDDLRDKKITTLVMENSFQYRILKRLLPKRDTHLIQTISWNDLWSVSTLEKILKGSHALIYAEGRLVEIKKIYRKYPLRVSEKRRFLKLSSFIMRNNIQYDIKTKINTVSVHSNDLLVILIKNHYLFIFLFQNKNNV